MLPKLPSLGSDHKPLSQFLFPEAENFRVGEFNSLYTVHCLKIGTGGSIIGGGGPTGNTWYIGVIILLIMVTWHNNGILA